MSLASASAVSVATVRRALATLFRDAGLDSPELDTRLLLQHALGVDHSALVRQSTRILSSAETERVRSLTGRRIGREPISRIVGTKEFWSLPFMITPAVLVPRPETETLVEAALQLLADHPLPKIRIADLGTGSGALLIALLHELKNTEGVGTDISPAALDVARMNARRLDLANRAAFVVSDFGAALRGGYDLIVSNPPYVADCEWAELAPEVRNHDPKLALSGGPDGLNAYRRIAQDVARLGSPRAHAIVELGAGKTDAVAEIFQAAGLVIRGTRPDLNGIARALIASPGPA